MPLYRYTGRDSTGRATAGKVEATDELDVARVMEAAGYFVTSVEPATAPVRGASKERAGAGGFFGPKIKRRDLIVLLRQLETLYRAGVPIAAGLDILEHQTENAALRKALQAISIEVREGLKLSEAFERHPRLFPPLVTANMLAGEETGALDEVLKRLAEHLEHEDELERFVKGSLRYPAIVIVALFSVIMLVTMFVFPKLTPLFRIFGDNLPLPTKVLKFLGQHAVVYGPLVIFGVFVAFTLFQAWKRTAWGRPHWERITLGLPRLGPILRKILVARFARSFAVVFKTGVPVLRALDIVAATVDHTILAKQIAVAKAKMSQGMGIADAMRDITIFPPLATHLLSVGEQTGRVDDLCNFLASHYEEEARYDLKSLLMLIEPGLTAVLAAFVGFTALGVFMPMWNMMDVVGKR